MTDTIVIPSGEVVALDAPLELLAEAFDELARLDQDVRTAKREISNEVARRLDHEGRRSYEVGDIRFEVNAPTEREWNLPELQATLKELVAEGTISEAKAMRCIKWDPRAVWLEVKALTSDPRCKARIEHTFKEVPATRYAKVRRAS